MPGVSYGVCKNSRNCGNWSVDLGDGYCVECWDNGLGGRWPREETRIHSRRETRG